MMINSIALDRIQKQKNIENKELAKRCGIHETTISRIRNTEHTTPITARKIANALEVSVDELLLRNE